MPMNNSMIKEIVNTIAKRYGTCDPFRIAETLNVDVVYAPFVREPKGMRFEFHGQPAIALSDEIRDSPQRYFVMAHELCHAIEHEGMAALYTSNGHWRGQLENQSDKFAVTLLSQFYIEENGCLPSNYFDLVHAYGFPTIGD